MTHATIQITLLLILIRGTLLVLVIFLQQVVHAIWCIYLVQFLSVYDSFVNNELLKMKIKWNTEYRFGFLILFNFQKCKWQFNYLDLEESIFLQL